MAMKNVIESFTITPEFLKLISEIDEFKGAWQALGTLAPERLSALKRVATIESIGSSTRIEGSKLSDVEIEALLSGLSVKQFETRDEQEVAGYAHVMDTIFNHYNDIDLTENYIKQLHRDLLQYSDKDARHRGAYKTNINHVCAFDEDGKEIGVVFETATPFDTPFRMQELVEFTNNALENNELHSILIIVIFIVTFLEIHPFQDGNGRLSRALTTLLLLKQGYVYVPYSSLESVIEFSKENYYKALRRTQPTIRTDNPDWEPWILFFLKALQQQKKKLETKIMRERIILGQLPELSIKILEIVKDHGRISVSQAVSLTGGNRNTVKKHLQSLVASNHLKQQGVGKGTWYERSVGEYKK